MCMCGEAFSVSADDRSIAMYVYAHLACVYEGDSTAVERQRRGNNPIYA
jgi:hypothetical protein